MMKPKIRLINIILKKRGNKNAKNIKRGNKKSKSKH